MDIVSKINGNTLSATEFNQIPTELEAGITASGQTPSDATLNQVPIFVSRFAANNFYIDSGSANAYVLTLAASMTNPVSSTVGYFVGMTIRFRAGNANTGASTVNVNSAGVKDLKKEDGTTDLAAGDITTDRDMEFRYDGTSFVLVQNALNATTSTKGVSLLPQQITIANGTDSEHDLDFTAGNAQAINGSGVYRVEALTKQIDATWVAGTNQGGMDTGSPPTDAPIYCYNIQNLTTGVGDVLYTISVPNATTKAYTGANMPSGWGNEDYIGACHTDGDANIRQGTWFYDSKGSQYEFVYDVGFIVDLSTATLPTASRSPQALSVPASSKALIGLTFLDNDATSSYVYISEENQTDQAVSSTYSTISTSSSPVVTAPPTYFNTNSSSQIYYRGDDAGVISFIIKTKGWKEYL